ncbi:hypothetical protein GCM10027456_31050 [Kineosporia babensis]
MAGSPFAPPTRVPTASEHLADGDRITHDRYGLGKVVSIVDDHEVLCSFKADAEGSTRVVSHLKLTKL